MRCCVIDSVCKHLTLSIYKKDKINDGSANQIKSKPLFRHDDGVIAWGVYEHPLMLSQQKIMIATRDIDRVALLFFRHTDKNLGSSYKYEH